MTNPIISVDRAANLIAIFDGPDLVQDFKPFDSEHRAIDEAKSVVAGMTDITPKLVYPRVDSIRLNGRFVTGQQFRDAMANNRGIHTNS